MRHTKHTDGRDHHHRAESHSAHNRNKSEHRHRGGHSHHHHNGHKRGQRRQRLFDYGELRLLVLSMIEGQPRHGYELIKEIETRFEGRYSPSPGVIYPTLSWLDDMGYVLQHTEGAKKQYLITDEGKAFLTANRDAADELLTRSPSSHDVGKSFKENEHHNLRELMGSLRHLIKEKLSHDDNDDNSNRNTRHEDIAVILQKAYDDIKILD